MVVLGPTGSGKTTVAKVIANKVLTKDNVSLTVIDWKGEYSQFIPMATIVRKIPNVWDIPGESAREKALLAVELVKEMSKDVVEVTPASSLLLLKVLEKEYEKGTPTTQKIIDILERNATIASKEGKWAEANMFYALARRLYVLLVDEERKDENVRGDPHIVIYDLGGLMSVYLKTLYSNYVLSKVYREAMKSRGGELRALLIAEEAQNYVHPRRPNELPSLAERLIYELRAFGVGVVLVCPDSELLPQPVLKDVAVIVSMSADTLPRFALERYLFRASLEEAEKTLKELKKAKMVVYFRGRLHFFRRLPKPPKELRLKTRPKLAPKAIEVKEEVEEKPKVIEIRKGAATEKGPKVIEIKEKESGEELKLEEEEFEEEPEAEVEVEKGPETVEEPVKIAEEEKAEMLEEEMPLEESKPEPVPKAELRLEEEVKEEPKETEEKEEEAKEEVSEAPSSQEGWEIFGHLLVEDLQAPGRVSVMRCVRCGASAPLTGLKTLKEMPCASKEVVRAEVRSTNT
jgi:energy-coupling factor transporter ATP-binding protein EcfA2